MLLSREHSWSPMKPAAAATRALETVDDQLSLYRQPPCYESWAPGWVANEHGASLDQAILLGNRHGASWATEWVADIHDTCLWLPEDQDLSLGGPTTPEDLGPPTQVDVVPQSPPAAHAPVQETAWAEIFPDAGLDLHGPLLVASDPRTPVTVRPNKQAHEGQQLSTGDNNQDHEVQPAHPTVDGPATTTQRSPTVRPTSVKDFIAGLRLPLEPPLI